MTRCANHHLHHSSFTNPSPGELPSCRFQFQPCSNTKICSMVALQEQGWRALFTQWVFCFYLHCRNSFLFQRSILVNVTVEINRHEQCDSHDPAFITNTFPIWCSPWYEMMMESRWISRTLPLSEIFLTSSLQKSSSLSFSWWTDSLRASEVMRELKGPSFTSVDSGGAERDWKLYRKQKSKLISSTLHPITCTNIRFVQLLLTWLIFSNSPQSSTFTALASFFTYSLE